MIKSTVTEKGQTTIPLPVREKLNLKPQQTLTWEVRSDGSVLIKSLPDVMELSAYSAAMARTDITSENNHLVRRIT